jgi:Uma2 family endonuclease
MAVMGTTTARITFEEFESMPEKPGKQELLDGELIELPPAKKKHNEIAENLYDVLRNVLRELHRQNECGSLGRVHHEMGYKLGSHGYLQPDVSITHRDQPSGDYFEGAPALAVEVMSESNRASDMDIKVQMLLSQGAVEVWLVFPNTRRVWVYHGATSAKVYSQILSTDLLPGAVIELSEIFG